MGFIVDERLFQLFPSLRVGILVGEIDNTGYGDDGLEPLIEQVRAGFPFEKPQDHPHIRVWRDAFRIVGIPAAKYYSSIESLLRRVLKGGPFARINPIVDLYNSISLKHLVPIGGHDLTTIEGDIAITFARGDEPFMPMDGGETELPEKNEVVYKDGRDILTRRWVWRQCNKDKATALTRSIFIPVDIMEGLPDSLCKEVMDDLERGIVENGYGRIVHRDVLTRDHSSSSF